MRFLLIIALFLFLLSGCTKNSRAKNFGGTQTIYLPTGYKLNEATWKNDDLWYLLEPVDTSYDAKVKIFQEDSSFGLLQGKIKFVEKN